MFDPVALRRVFAAFPTGVTAVAALVDDEPVGMAASSFTSVSLDPALVSVAIARTSRTWSRLKTAPRLGVSVLSALHEQGCRRLGEGGADRFAELAWTCGQSGELLVDNASAWLRCSVDGEFRAGDHDIVLLRVHELDHDPAIAPLVFHGSRYRRLEHDGW